MIGVYELKTHAALQIDLQKAKTQAGAEHLQLAFTVSMPIASRHPGCMLVMGDLNANFIWMPILPGKPSEAVDQIDAPDIADGGATLARAAHLIRARLDSLASSRYMASINAHEGTYAQQAMTDDSISAPTDIFCCLLIQVRQPIKCSPFMRCISQLG